MNNIDTKVMALEAQFKRGFKTLIVATALLFALLLGLSITMFAFATSQRAAISERSSQVQAALCAVRQDIQHSVDTTEQFLEDHPEGIPGIPVEILRSQLRERKGTLEALSTLRCDNG